MIVNKHLGKEVDSFWRAEVGVLVVDERAPLLLGLWSQRGKFVGVELYFELIQISIEILGSQYIGNLYELVDIFFTKEEMLFAEDL